MTGSGTISRLALHKDDEVVIRGVSFQPAYCNSEGWIFEVLDGSGPAQSFTHEQLSRMSATGEITHNRGKFRPAGALKELHAKTDNVALLSGKDLHRVKLRTAFCEAFIKLKREGRIETTDASIRKNMNTLRFEASAFFEDEAANGLERSYVGGFQKIPAKVGARSLRRWLKAYEHADLAGLADRRWKSGNRTSHLSAEEVSLLMREVRGYASPQAPTQKTIFDNVRNAFEAANAERRANKRAPFKVPSREAVRRAIHKLDPFTVDVARLSRSSLVTIGSSPSRGNSVMVRSSPRPSRLAPDCFSCRMISHPSALSRVTCRRSSSAPGLTRT